MKLESGKARLNITIDGVLDKWVDDMIAKKEFGSKSHAIEKALLELKSRMPR